MKYRIVVVTALLLATFAGAAVFERYLSKDRPEDRAILAYMELDTSGKARSDDLAELGVLLMAKGFPKDAERYLARAVKLDKNNVEARYRLGLVLQREGRLHAAMRQYKKVIKARPGHAYARFMLALAEERGGSRDRAAFDYAKAYKHAPELADPAKNPLVLDSRLQVEAQLLRYQRETDTSTPPIEAIDPAAVQRMMIAAAPPPPAGPAPAAPPPAAAAHPTPIPTAVLPPPAAVPTPLPAGAQPAAVAPSPVHPPALEPRGERRHPQPVTLQSRHPKPTPTPTPSPTPPPSR